MEALALQPLLQFSHPVAEQAYQAHSASFHVELDKKMARTHLIAILVQQLVIARVLGVPVDAYAMIYLATIAAQYFVTAYGIISEDTYKQHRTLILLTFRAVYDSTSLTGLAMWSPPSQVTSPMAFFRHLLVTSGIGMQIWLGCTVVISFRLYVWLHLLTNVMYSFALNDATCGSLVSTPLGQSLTRTIWKGICRLGTWTMQLGWMSSVGSGSELSGVPECWAMMAFMQLVLGYILPASVLYCLEYRSRHFFQAYVLRVPRAPAPGWGYKLALGLAQMVSICGGVFCLWELTLLAKQQLLLGS